MPNSQQSGFKRVNYDYKGPFKLKEIASVIGSELEPDFAELEIVDLSSLSAAKKGDLTFFDNSKYLEQFRNTAASACIVHPKYTTQSPKDIALLIVNDPYTAYAKIANYFYKPVKSEHLISPTAFIEPSAKIGRGVEIGHASYIGKDVVIGDNTKIASNVTITTAHIGANCIIHSGVRIGQDGFGFAMGASHLKVPQLGGVRIGDDVEIGANSCIDRGSGPDTIIGSGTKIDNQVQIGHNVEIGKNCVIVAQVGIAGSTKLQDYVVVGGQAGIVGHLKIGTGTRIAAGSGVIKNLEAGSVVGGYPAINIRDWHKSTIMIEKLIRGERKND